MGSFEQEDHQELREARLGVQYVIGVTGGVRALNAPYHNKALPDGSILREWRLEEVLGVGGFGIVYRGRGLYFNELVAIKEYFPGAISDRVDGTTVSPNDSSSEDIYTLGLSKFVEEAKILWNLSRPERHPNIVSVRSLFEIHGTAYMVMDFEEGVSLSQLLKAGRKFSEAELLAALKAIARGLDRAHRAGVLHRDIKPANILIDEAGRPVLIDFGSARFDSGQATSTKVTFYTPPYAALEQYVKTYPQGPWTDIYALGVTLYECVMGQKPAEVLERLHGEADEPLAGKDLPNYSQAFLKAIDAAMAIKPADRPQTIDHWLRLFDAETAPEAVEATQIATFRDEPAIAAPSSKPEPPAAAATPQTAPPPVAATKPPEALKSNPERAPAKSPPTRLFALGGVFAAVVVAGVVVALRGTQHPPVAAPAGPVPVVAAAAPAPGASAANLASSEVKAALEGLATDAQAAGRPQRDIAALASASQKLAVLATQNPLPAAEIERVARDAAKGVTSPLAKDAARQVREVERSRAWATGGDPVISAVKHAKSALDAAAAEVGQAPDAVSAVAGARKAVAAQLAFARAMETARPALLAAQKAQIAPLESSAKQAATEIEALAGKSKPWLLASKDHKARYQQLQDYAAQAKAKAVDADRAAREAEAAGDLKSANAAIDRLAAAAHDIDGLKAQAAAAAR